MVDVFSRLSRATLEAIARDLFRSDPVAVSRHVDVAARTAEIHAPMTPKAVPAYKIAKAKKKYRAEAVLQVSNCSPSRFQHETVAMQDALMLDSLDRKIMNKAQMANKYGLTIGEVSRRVDAIRTRENARKAKYATAMHDSIATPQS